MRSWPGPPEMLTTLSGLARPAPPSDLLGADGALTDRPFMPAPELEAWARAVFIEEDGILANAEHAHLQHAALGFLWCSEPNARQMNRVVGQAETGAARGGRWQKVRQEQQMVEWFGAVPDFLVTFHADYAAECDDASFCALIEHELYHCGQERDAFGVPKFRSSGLPAFAIRGHDVEEFVGVVERYGVGAAAGRTADLVRAANKGPTVASSMIHGACGTCGRLVA